MSGLIILIPSYNEIKSLRKIVLSIKDKYKILVVNDGSTDGTVEFLKKNKINQVINKNNQGYTLSLIKGINFIKNNFNKKYILTIDADGEHRLSFIKKIYNEIKKKNLDLVIGNRNFKNRISETLISKYVDIKYGIKDPFSGFKIYKVDYLYKYINKVNKKKFLIDLVSIYLKNSLKIKNINIKVNKIKKRKSRTGIGIITNIKMLSSIKYFI
jgi:glycosyltransferase involved in cell wall biosynthesis